MFAERENQKLLFEQSCWSNHCEDLVKIVVITRLSHVREIENVPRTTTSPGSARKTSIKICWLFQHQFIDSPYLEHFVNLSFFEGFNLSLLSPTYFYSLIVQINKIQYLIHEFCFFILSYKIEISHLFAI